MLLVIDNYDSFTYNLVQYFGELGAEMKVFRNDEITLDEIADLAPDRILISPGPKAPKDAGVSCETIRRFGEKTPIFGVCLGHQSIGEVYGGEVIRAPRLMPDCLEITAETTEGEIMGLRHKELPVHGVQFHPESILTTEGKSLLQNFLDL